MKLVLLGVIPITGASRHVLRAAVVLTPLLLLSHARNVSPELTHRPGQQYLSTAVLRAPRDPTPPRQELHFVHCAHQAPITPAQGRTAHRVVQHVLLAHSLRLLAPRPASRVPRVPSMPPPISLSAPIAPIPFSQEKED